MKKSTPHLSRILGSETLGSRDGAVARTLASHQYGLGSIPARCHMWVEFVVGSRLDLRFSLRVHFPNSNRPFPSYPVPAI